MFLHELPDAKDLFLVLSEERGINPSIIEKDYWVMHVLWGLQQQGFNFELKGGTSLSKGFDLINRFSEDIDIQVYPDPVLQIKYGKNQNKVTHIESRILFFDSLASNLDIAGLHFKRDHEFDDTSKMRSAGIRGSYESHFPSIEALKDGVLLEIGFDKTTPNTVRTISSWAFEKAILSGINIFDNRAKDVKCYLPEYTFVEKLQTISTKYRVNKQKERASPVNFIRHYYDIYMLLNTKLIQDFIRTDEYKKYKIEKFGTLDELDLTLNPAFTLSGQNELNDFSSLYKKKSEIYFDDSPSFEKIIEFIQFHASVL